MIVFTLLQHLSEGLIRRKDLYAQVDSSGWIKTFRDGLALDCYIRDAKFSLTQFRMQLRKCFEFGVGLK